MGGIARWAFGVLAFVASIDSWIQIIWPALSSYLAKKPSLLQLAADLAKPISPIRPEVPLYGYLLLTTAFVISALIYGAMRAFFLYLENSFVPISVLRTSMELTFEKDDLSVARLNRRQIYHANRPGVTAYHLNRSVDSAGASIDTGETYCSSSVNHRGITDGKPLLLGNSKKIEIIERFSKPLPINPIASLLPDSLVLALYRLGAFRGVVASREFHTVDYNEYNGSEARFGLTSLRYPVSNVDISILFPSKSEPREIKFFHITDNTAIELFPHYRKQGGASRYKVSIRKFSRSSIYVYWKNTDSVRAASVARMGSVAAAAIKPPSPRSRSTSRPSSPGPGRRPRP